MALANAVLDDFCVSSYVSICYLMDGKGTTLASTNRNTPESFVGRNYAFRPYFREAIAGAPAVYLALGVTSKKRGVYFSNHVEPSAGQGAGVVVMKAPVEKFESQFSGYPGIIALTDPNGVIFATNRPEWLFHTLWPVAETKTREIQKTRQFGEVPPPSLDLQPVEGGQVVGHGGRRYLFDNGAIDRLPGWNVIYLLDTANIQNPFPVSYRPWGLGFVGLFIAISGVAFALFRTANSEIQQRVRVEEQTRQSEARYRRLMEDAIDAIFITDAEGRYMDVNSAAGRLVGYSRDQLLSMRMEELVSEEEAAQTGKRREALLSGKAATFERRLRRADGAFVPVEISATRLSDGTLQGIVRDITERKNAEGALRASADIVEAIPSGLFIYRFELPDRLILLDGNRASAELTGVSADDWRGREFNEIWPQGREFGITEAFLRVIKTGETYETEDLYYKDDKLEGAFLVRAFRVTEDRFCVAFENVFKRRLAETALRDSEEKYRQLFETESDALVLVEEETGNILDVNRSMETLYGYSRDELLGMRNVDVSAQPDETQFAARDRTTAIPIRWHRKKDGTIFPTEITASHCRFQGRWVQLAAIRDITQRMEAEKELRVARDVADAASAAKTMFLANMSHELRTPLNSIIGFSEMLEGEFFGSVGSDKNREYVGDIKRSGTHLLRIISDILDVSKIEAGAVDLEKEEIDIREIVDACMTMIRARSMEAGIELVTKLPDGLPSLLADSTALKQILLNLLSNAIRFTPGEGKVTVEVVLDGEGASVLKVTDTGVGIAAEDIPRILEPFCQVGEIMTRNHEGAGLGLSLARSLMELHGGTLELESAVGVGTIAVARFPPERTLAN